MAGKSFPEQSHMEKSFSGVAVLVSFSWSKFPLPYKGERYLCTCMQEKQDEKTTRVR